ncbi:hypothetical protein R6Z07F_002162 [Ovis aries]
MPEQSNDYRVAVFGAGGVGKSSLVLRFVKGTFRESYIPTVEDTYRQVISCDKSICTLQITDTTGSHQFPAMQRLSISKGHAFILVYSITSRQSLEELKPIYEQICEIKGDVESIPIMLVGNKCDESPNREVESSEAEVLARKWKCAFMETSAKLNLNVKELFQELLNLEKRRTVSLQIDGKKSKQQKRKEKLKGNWNLSNGLECPILAGPNPSLEFSQLLMFPQCLQIPQSPGCLINPALTSLICCCLGSDTTDVIRAWCFLHSPLSSYIVPLT